ncbi:hypothetical protein SAMN05661012_04854 [Chitinophaga sancti]|uniref:TonB-dependent receptor n=2 Tax=Chitinophaga sancti TaxID=1004 RepID=A0A1K1S715_9BACT|nr:hypothetical protein SAMN05661012_04854 [Chitinophaga sancti]
MQFCFFEHHNSKLNTLRYFLLLLFLPVLSTAQTNEDYMRLVRKADTSRRVFALPQSSVNRDVKRVKGNLRYPYSTQRIGIAGNEFVLQDYVKTISFSGSYTTAVALCWANQQPRLQKDYAQGLNNQYLGPETGTLFSYGPAIAALEYDGIANGYDKNGQLVPKGSGNGRATNAYNNGILRTGMNISNDFLLKTTYLPFTGNPWSLGLKVGREDDKSIIRLNNNREQKFGLDLEHKKRDLRITLSYDDVSDHFDYSNRNGLLNRAYQYSLLTPPSFENAQGTMIGNSQRSYSIGADNPLFLLQDHDNGFRRHSRNANIKIENKTGPFSYTIVSTYQHDDTKSTEVYAAGTTGFPNGSMVQRYQKDNRLLTRGNVKYEAPLLFDGNFKNSVELNYNYSNMHTDIRYQDIGPDYRYKRNAHEPNLTYLGQYDLYPYTFMLKLSDQGYASNTTNRQNFWLPGGAIVLMKNIYIRYHGTLSIALSSHFNQFNSELPIQQSQAALNLLNYTSSTLSKFSPIKEADYYSRLQPIHHMEWDVELDAVYRKFRMTVSYYQRQTDHDVVPVISNDNIQLKNIAAYINKGLEITFTQFDIPIFQGAGRFNNRLSFSTNRHYITSVAEGYNYTPTAGLSDVHTALVVGAPSNVIVGSAYLRDANHQIVTDANGQAMVDPQLKVIGNPNPKFYLALTNYLSYGAFELGATWQWKNGGEKWNGTAAMLDYYGRSANSAIQRKAENIPRTPVAENYIQRADFLRLNNISLSVKRSFKGYVNNFKLTGFLRNLLLWTPYKGVDPSQSILDQGQTSGLDLFNLPATTTAGIEATISF